MDWHKQQDNKELIEETARLNNISPQEVIEAISSVFQSCENAARANFKVMRIKRLGVIEHKQVVNKRRREKK